MVVRAFLWINGACILVLLLGGPGVLGFLGTSWMRLAAGLVTVVCMIIAWWLGLLDYEQ